MKKFITAICVLSSLSAFAYVIEPSGTLYKVTCKNGSVVGYTSTVAEATSLGNNKCGQGNFNVTTGKLSLSAEKQVK